MQFLCHCWAEKIIWTMCAHDSKCYSTVVIGFSHLLSKEMCAPLFSDFTPYTKLCGECQGCLLYKSGTSLSFHPCICHFTTEMWMKLISVMILTERGTLTTFKPTNLFKVKRNWDSGVKRSLWVNAQINVSFWSVHDLILGQQQTNYIHFIKYNSFI